MRGEDELILANTLVYFGTGLRPQAFRIIELWKAFRDMATSMLDIYLSSISSANPMRRMRGVDDLSQPSSFR